MATEAWVLEKATIGEGDEVANSLAARTLLLQAGQTSDSALITAIKAVTDLIPDAGALAVPTADAAPNVDWGDVIGNKSDAASDAATASLMALLRKTIEEVEEVEQHIHNIERWWGALAVPDETNATEANVGRPFAATSGADAWGAAIPIKGSADIPCVAGQTTFDIRELLITDLDDDTTPWRIRIIWGTGTSGDAITAGQWTEQMTQSNAVPGNRAGASPLSVLTPRRPVADKLWAQAWNDTNGEIISFFWGAHGYPRP